MSYFHQYTAQHIIFPPFSTILSQHYAQTCLRTILRLVYLEGELSKQGGLREKIRKRGLKLTEEEGIGRKVQDRSYVAGIRVILLTPSTPIHPLRWCMKIHLCYKPGGKTTQRKRARDTKDGWKDRCISTGWWITKTKWYHWAGQIQQFTFGFSKANQHFHSLSLKSE